MTATIISALISAVTAIVCAVIAADNKLNEKRRAADSARAEARAKLRTKEGRLQLAMLSANSELTVGCAIALKTGRANGEIEAGLAKVKQANDDYTKFLESVAIDDLKGA